MPLTLAGLIAAFGVASFCSLPFVLATLGLGTACLSGFALLGAPHRVFVLAVTSVCLVGAAGCLWRQCSAISCAPSAICTRPTVRSITVIGLLVGTVLLYLG